MSNMPNSPYKSAANHLQALKPKSLRDFFLQIGLSLPGLAMIAILVYGGPDSSELTENAGNTRRNVLSLAHYGQGARLGSTRNPNQQTSNAGEYSGEGSTNSHRGDSVREGSVGSRGGSQESVQDVTGTDARNAEGLQGFDAPNREDQQGKSQGLQPARELLTSQNASPERLNDAINVFLSDLEYQQERRIAAILSWYGTFSQHEQPNIELSGLPLTEEVMSVIAGRNVRHLQDFQADMNPVLEIQDPDFAPAVLFTPDQERRRTALVNRDRNLLALAAYLIDLGQLPQEMSQAITQRRQYTDYAVMTPVGEVELISSYAEFSRIASSRVGSSRLSQLLDRFIAQESVPNAGVYFRLVIREAFSLIANTQVQWPQAEARGTFINSFWSFLNRLQAQQSTALPPQELQQYIDRIEPIQRASLASLAQEKLAQLLALESSASSERFAAILSHTSYGEVVNLLNLLKQGGNNELYSTVRGQVTTLLDNMSSHYRGTVLERGIEDRLREVRALQ